jgi:hypothetical protein
VSGVSGTFFSEQNILTFFLFFTDVVSYVEDREVEEDNEDPIFFG